MFPDNFKMLFDMNNVDPKIYQQTIMYPDSIVSFCRTGITYNAQGTTGFIISLNESDKDRIEYIVLEPDDNEMATLSVKFKQVDEKINKLKMIVKLYEELMMEVPYQISSLITNLESSELLAVNHQYNGKKMLIYNIDKYVGELICDIKKIEIPQ